MSKLTIITTGGTIDKVYFDAKSAYQIGDPQIGEILHAFNVAIEFEIVALMRKHLTGSIKTFTIGYEDKSFSELDYAEIVARHCDTDHNVLILDTLKPEYVEKTLYHLDEPMTDLSTVPLYLLCKQAREHVTVCLSGEGADESFAFGVPNNLQEGDTITLKAAAQDSLGLVAESTAVILTVQDLLPPLVTIVSPVNNASFGPGALVDVFVRGDDSSGITRLELDTSGALVSSQVRDIVPVTSPAAETFSIQIPADAQPTDIVTLIARATDTSGNSATRNIALRITDDIAPHVTLTSASGSLNVEPGGQASIQVAPPETKKRTRSAPRYKVLIHNDPVTPMDAVVRVVW